MNKCIFKSIAVLAVSVFVGVTVSSCGDDPDKVILIGDEPNNNTIEVGVKDGVFKMENLTTGKEIALSHSVTVQLGTTTAMCYGGDTVKLTFASKEKYKDKRFSVDCMQLTKLNDSLFVVPVGEKKDTVIAMQLDLKASYYEVSENNNLLLSATESAYITYKSSFYFDVSYRYGISPDLLMYVTPELTYTDQNGTEITTMLAEADMEPQTIKVDGADVVLSLNYLFESAFQKRGVNQVVSVRYRAKDGVQLAADHCDFWRGLNWSAPGYTNVNVDISNESTAGNLSKAQEYLDKLLAESDTLVLKITKTGEISSLN